MAKISTLQTNRQVRAPVTGGKVSANLDGPRALARAAEALTGLGMKIVQKREQAEATDFISTSMATLSVKHNEMQIKAQKEFPESAKGYSEFMKKGMNKEVANLSKNSPNSRASNAFNSRTATFMGSVEINADSFEAKQSTKFFRKNAKDTSDFEAASFEMSPDTDAATLAMASETNKYAGLSGNVFSPEEARKMRDESVKNIWTSNISGYTKIGEYNIARKLADLNPDAMYSSKQLNSITNNINATEERELGIQVRNEALEVKRRKQEVEQSEQQVLADAFAPGADSEKVLKSALLNKKLNPANYVKFRRQASALDQIDSTEFVAVIRNLQAGGVSDARIMGVIQADVNLGDGLLTGQDAGMLFKEMANKKKISTSSMRSKRIGDAARTIKATIVNPIVPTQSQKISSAQAISKLNKRMENKDLDPDTEMRKILRETVGDFKSQKFVEGVNPQFQMGGSSQEQTQASFNKGMKQLKAKRERKLLTAGQYKIKLRELKNRMDSYNREFFQKGSFDAPKAE